MGVLLLVQNRAFNNCNGLKVPTWKLVDLSILLNNPELIHPL